MNIAVFAGRLGRDAEIRTTQGGTRVAGFSLAVDIRDGSEKSTMWVDCALFGKLADALGQYLTKGRQVTVTGPIRLREFQKRDGTSGASINLMVNDITLQGGGQQKAEPDGRAYAAASQGDLDDEIPF